MVHAGVAPSWSLQMTLNLSAEIEHALQGGGYKAYLKNMYGNEPIRWSKSLRGHERLRTIPTTLPAFGSATTSAACAWTSRKASARRPVDQALV